MKLARYGIMLETMTIDHLEMVRLWRNQDHVRSNMQFKKMLSRTDQQRWFATLDANANLYWIIRYNDYPIGLIHIKEIDRKTATGEAGIFIGEPSYLEMPQPMLAILFMMELAFYALHLKQLKAKILSNNSHAIRFNEQLGYTAKHNPSKGFHYYTVNQHAFEIATEKIRNGALRMYGSNTGMQLNIKSQWDNQLKELTPFAKEYFKPFGI